MTTKPQRTPAFAQGYIIADEDGRCQLYTLDSNPRDCWSAFLAHTGYVSPHRGRAQSIRDFRAMGFRAVRVVLQEA